MDSTAQVEPRQHILTAYQANYVLDDSPLTNLVKSRRIGGTYAATLKVAWRAAGFDPRTNGFDPTRPGDNEYLTSPTIAQSKEMLQEVMRHLELLEQLHAVPGQMRPYAENAGVRTSPMVLSALAKTAVHRGLLPNAEELIAGAQMLRIDPKRRTGLIKHASSRQIVLTNGRVIEVKAANERTFRSIGGNVTGDEWGQVPYADKLYANGIRPVAASNLGRRKRYKVGFLGTAWGDANHFYRLARTEEGRLWSRHEITIYDAVRAKFPIDPEVERAEVGDEEAFLQEYCCEFLSATARYIPDTLLDDAAYDPSEPEYESELERAKTGKAPRFGGLDVARSIHGDLSALALVVKIGDVYWLLPEMWADRNVPFTAQKERVRGELQAGARRVAIDSHGLGNNMAEDLQREYGESRIELVPMVAPNKEDLATRLKRLLSQKRLRLPTGERLLRREIMALKRDTTAAGNTRFDIERTRKGGHGDRAWALMLALHAAENAPAPYEPRLRRGR